MLLSDWLRALSNQSQFEAAVSYKCISVVAVCFVGNGDFEILWS